MQTILARLEKQYPNKDIKLTALYRIPISEQTGVVDKKWIASDDENIVANNSLCW